eukprot:TRINITY_DN8603_c2_g2_i1.p1 TRINITY_DN8603_c2_g2~~TRINITY_DN8603_c2_g2_i1.p1  ORF type:complete len:283 (-),score=33.99 TRINITY_DN8603_c2_g2_i1:83-931(-)
MARLRGLSALASGLGLVLVVGCLSNAAQLSCFTSPSTTSALKAAQPTLSFRGTTGTSQRFQPAQFFHTKAQFSGSAFSSFSYMGMCAAAVALTSCITRFAKGKVKAKENGRLPFNPLKKHHGRPLDYSDPRLGFRIKGGPGRTASPHWWYDPIRWCKRMKKHISIRKKQSDGTPHRPRMQIFRSLHHTLCCVVDDTTALGATLVTVTTKQRPLLDQIRDKTGCPQGEEPTWSLAAAELVGSEVAKQCLEKGITVCNYDRGGYPYSGRVKALHEAARQAGLMC